MKRGEVDLNKLRASKEKYDFRGKTAYCFLNGKNIIKIYAQEDDDEYKSLNKDLIEDFSQNKSKIIVFPQEYLYQNGVKVGEISRFIKDKSLLENNFYGKIMVNSLIKNYNLVVNELKRINNIYMHDLDSVNILYSGRSGFHIIDVTEWTYKSDSSNINIYYFNRTLFRSICDFIGLPTFYHDFINTKITYNILYNEVDYGNLGKEFYNLIECNLMDDYHIVEFLEAYRAMYQIYYDREMKTLNQMKNYTKILKKG